MFVPILLLAVIKLMAPSLSSSNMLAKLAGTLMERLAVLALETFKDEVAVNVATLLSPTCALPGTVNFAMIVVDALWEMGPVSIMVSASVSVNGVVPFAA